MARPALVLVHGRSQQMPPPVSRGDAAAEAASVQRKTIFPVMAQDPLVILVRTGGI